MLSGLGKYRSHIRNMGAYLLSALIPMAFSLAANPFFAKNLDPQDYAIIGYYGSFNALFLPLILFYIINYYQKRFFEVDESERQHIRATLTQALVWFSLAMTVVSVLIVWGYTAVFVRNDELPFFPYAILSLAVIPLTGIYSMQLVEYKMNRRSAPFLRLSLVFGLLSLGISLLMVVGLKWGAAGKLGGVLCGNLIVFIWCLYLNRKSMRAHFDWAVFRKMLLFCTPLVVAGTLEFFTRGFDRVFLERVVDTDTLGYYSVGFSIAAYLGVFASAVFTTFSPDIYHAVVTRDMKRCLRYALLQTGVIALAAAAFIVLAPFVIRILTAGRYMDSVPYAKILSLSAVTAALCYVTADITNAMGYTRITLINKIIGSVLCVGAYFLLIDRWGAIGASWAVVSGFLIMFIVNVLILWWYKRHKIAAHFK